MTQCLLLHIPDSIDLSTVGAKHVRTALILPLPVRVRTGTLFRLTVDSSFEVVFRNGLDIPYATTTEETSKLTWVGKTLRPTEEFLTEAMIVDRHPIVDDADAKRIAEGDAKAPLAPDKRLFLALEALNESIVAYHSATHVLFAGYPVQRLTHREFIERNRYFHTILSPPDYVFTDQQFHEIFNTHPERRFIRLGGQFGLELADCPPEQISSIQNYLKAHRQFLFYQFALDAKTKMAEMDFVSAILFAAVAIEGAHAVLLQLCLQRIMGETVPDPKVRAKLVEEKANTLLKEVGFSEMVEITSMMLVEEADRPSPADVAACKLGITIRNDIMHASIKHGKYKLRNRTNDQISDAYGNILKLYQHFVSVIEKKGV
jgi:hypothetical protein